MYSVIAHDGQSYGPVDIPTLLRWCQQGRIVSDTLLMEAATGRTLTASLLPDLRAVLASAAMPQPGPQTNPYGQAPYTQAPYTQAPYTQAPHSLPSYPPNPYAQAAPGSYSQDPYQQRQAPPSMLPPQGYVGPSQVGPFHTSASQYGMLAGRKSRVTALWLCAIFGSLGAHRFYLGHRNSGIAILVAGALVLLVSMPFMLNLMLCAVALLWPTIDFFAILGNGMRDSNGQTLV